VKLWNCLHCINQKVLQLDCSLSSLVPFNCDSPVLAGLSTALGSVRKVGLNCTTVAVHFHGLVVSHCYHTAVE